MTGTRAILAILLLLSLFAFGCCVYVASDAAGTPRSDVEGYECMESPGCFDQVQRCYDGICTPQSSCGVIHWDNASACNCTQDIGPWTRQATGSCGTPAQQ